MNAGLQRRQLEACSAHLKLWMVEFGQVALASSALQELAPNRLNLTNTFLANSDHTERKSIEVFDAHYQTMRAPTSALVDSPYRACVSIGLWLLCS